MVQQPAEARSLNGVEAPQLSRDAVHEPFMFVLKTKILQDFDRRCLKLGVADDGSLHRLGEDAIMIESSDDDVDIDDYDFESDEDAGHLTEVNDSAGSRIGKIKAIKRLGGFYLSAGGRYRPFVERARISWLPRSSTCAPQLFCGELWCYDVASCSILAISETRDAPADRIP